MTLTETIRMWMRHKEVHVMIPVTAIEGVATLIDVDEISAIESTPETVIVLADGRRMLSADSAETLVRRIARERARRIARNVEPSRNHGEQR